MGRHFDVNAYIRSIMNGINDEKRFHERQPFTNNANYTVLSAETEFDGQGNFAVTVDLCMDGIGIRTNVLLEPGRIVRLKSERENIHGIVRWIRPENRGELYRAGIQFVERMNSAS
ncbi:MAG TPA: PilZ domain-containing protein [Nitrospirota bacterium]|nr:PilZ domain-containing protein [Nitrospirota bacterium]